MSRRSQSTLETAASPRQQSGAAPRDLRKGPPAGAPGSHPELRGAFGARSSPGSGADPAAASRPHSPGTNRGTAAAVDAHQRPSRRGGSWEL